MPGPTQVADEQALIAATRPFAAEDRRASWWYLLSTLAALSAAIAGALRLPALPLRVGASVLAGLLLVRMFILFHDHVHGAILRGPGLGRALLYGYGMLVLVPPRVWRETHNYHHAHTAKLVGSNVGSYVTVNLSMWRRMPSAARLMYRLQRHPVTIALGYLTVFLYGTCISSFVRAPRKHWSSGVAIGLHAGLTVLLITTLGLERYALAMLLPLLVACGSGAYLFYAQHNFPALHIQPRESWSFTRAALESSSYMRLGPVARWFTGNIGFHHVHHLNPTIPFYRLPEAMASVRELQHPGITTLRPRDILATFRQNIWDEERGRMISYADARAGISPGA